MWLKRTDEKKLYKNWITFLWVKNVLCCRYLVSLKVVFDRLCNCFTVLTLTQKYLNASASRTHGNMAPLIRLFAPQIHTTMRCYCDAVRFPGNFFSATVCACPYTSYTYTIWLSVFRRQCIWRQFASFVFIPALSSVWTPSTERIKHQKLRYTAGST